MKPLLNHANKSPLMISMLLSSLLFACTQGPNYVKPEVPVPTHFKEQAGWKVAEPQDVSTHDDWWKVYHDEVLNQLVAQVAISNQSLKVAEAQYRQALALSQQAQAAKYPSLTANLSTIRSRPRSNLNNAINFLPNLNTAYNVSLGASWETDLWGRVKRTIEAGNAGAQASANDLASAKLSVQAQLVQNYFLLRIADAQKSLMNRTVASFEKSLKLTQNQYAVGIVSRADVVAAETQLKSAKAQAVNEDVARAQLEHAIAILIGKAPADFAITPTETLTAQLPESIPLVVPSKLLERRPDIAAAERRIAQANAQIGVVQAAYYPDLTISATAGFQSNNFSRWLTYPARFWSLGPTFAQTIFDGGLRKAQSAQAIAAYDENVANYRQTILGAFQEVEDNLSTLNTLAQEAQLQDDAVKSARESVNLATNQYKAGIVNYLNVINTETTALNNERTALSIQSNQLVASVLLIKGLGGGWKSSPAK